jgi:acyl-coenzyme A thioesterase PaaI-like protein
MKHKVVGKQQNSKMCLVCGLKNPHSMRAAFYELEGDQLAAVFRPMEEHQGYPGRLHGGLAAAILDETIGRAIMMRYEEEVWGVTAEFTIRFKKPIPLDEELRVVGRITMERGRIFEGSGEILLPGGEVAAVGRGKYIKQPLESIADFDAEKQEWRVVPLEQDPAEIEI